MNFDISLLPVAPTWLWGRCCRHNSLLPVAPTWLWGRCCRHNYLLPVAPTWLWGRCCRHNYLLPVAPTWLWGRCCRHNSLLPVAPTWLWGRCCRHNYLLPVAPTWLWGRCCSHNYLLPVAPTWLWGRCCRHNSPPASSVMDSILCCPDSSDVSVDTVHPSLLRSSHFYSPRWYHLQSLSSDVCLVPSLRVSKSPQSCYSALLVTFSTFSLYLVLSLFSHGFFILCGRMLVDTSSTLSLPFSSRRS